MKKRKSPKQETFKFQPFSKKQRQVLNWWTETSPVKDMDGIIADGAIRSGKTVSMSLSFVMWAMSSFDGENFAMCGKTIQSLRRNVIKQLKKMLKSRGYVVEEHRSENYMTISFGEIENDFYFFGGKDESSQDLIQGLTLAGVFFDEVALMPESFVNQATGRCSVDGSKMWFNCNPEGPYHWFKTEWIDKCKEKNIIYLHFTMDDNLSLSEKIKARYRSMYVGVFFQRYILGLWAVAEGLVYSMFDHDKHVVSAQSWKEKDKRYRYFVAIDYGVVNPFAVGVFAFDGRKSTMIKEFHYAGREAPRIDNERYYEALKTTIGDIPVEKIIIDPSAATFIATIRKYGDWLVQGANNDVLDGIAEVTKYLNLGLLQITDECPETEKEFATYSWDDKAIDHERVVKEHDHHMDLIRYYIMSVPRVENVWSV